MSQSFEESLEPALMNLHAAEEMPTWALAPIGVFAIDEQPLFRRGLAAMLAADSAFCWLGEASTGAAAVAVARTVCPDVVFVDLHMPDLDGVATVEALRPLWPSARFVVMASRIEAAEMRRVVAVGASCMHKSVSPLELVAAIRAVRRGQRVLSPAVITALESSAREAPLRNDLTPRERALLQLMAQGLDNRSISQSLAISVPTVKFHVTNILSKLHAANRTAAVLAALREKIIRLDGPLAASSGGG
jgi:NarL family two-component system response regulator LiaR